jgi:hypothetical protein
VRRGRRGYDVPSDHFTRYELDLMREQAARYVDLDVVEGISVGWGLPAWTRVTDRMPGFVVGPVLRALDAVARAAPRWADVVVLAGTPRATASGPRFAA